MTPQKVQELLKFSCEIRIEPDFFDLEEPGYLRFSKDGMGQFVFGTVNGFI